MCGEGHTSQVMILNWCGKKTNEKFAYVAADRGDDILEGFK